MIVEPGPVQDKEYADQEALEEIRQLFARYREIARHGQAKERDVPPVARIPKPERAKRVPGR